MFWEELMETIKNQLGIRSWNASSEAFLRRRLERNERDIAQFTEKLHSYSFEPKTYVQFKQLADLKEEARELREANRQITMSLRDEAGSVQHCSDLLERHLKKVERYAQAVRNYMGETKLHETACF